LHLFVTHYLGDSGELPIPDLRRAQLVVTYPSESIDTVAPELELTSEMAPPVPTRTSAVAV
jgi:hypothetical protein